ncbi:MAG: hypothetical protein KDK25_13280 [Leptospiraceae bacterium]|nr:hypothetical protein [Leptospiraceae bacterium]
MKLSDLMGSQYGSTGLMSAIPDSIRNLNPDMEWANAPFLESVHYPEELEISFDAQASYCRFSFAEGEAAQSGADGAGISSPKGKARRREKEGPADALTSPGPSILEDAEIRLTVNGDFLAMLVYEMQQERATLITLGPTEHHSDSDRDFVGRASKMMQSPDLNWYSGFGWGAIAQIRSDRDGTVAFVLKDSDSRYRLEFYYVSADQEIQAL